MQIPAMVSGILVFAALYAFLEYSWLHELVATWPTLRRTLNISYGIRLGVSIVIPIGAFPDMFTGVFSMGLVAQLFRSGALQNRIEGNLTGFFPIFLTTLVQGIFMHIVLFALMLIVYAACRFLGGMPARGETPAVGESPFRETEAVQVNDFSHDAE